jgi:murein DD-endopeptidase MepM/ murein hydrolase activator NlpD
MRIYTVYGEEFVPRFSFPIKGSFTGRDLIPIDLSVNSGLREEDYMTLEGLQNYVFGKIKKAGALGGYGGYAEKRAIYRKSGVFTSETDWRSIHLGLDIWFPAGTEVCAPLPGKVYGFGNNDAKGDYGPTIILEHVLGNESFHTLYGHLSEDSLEGLSVGKMILRGESFARLGRPAENVDWPPHLHFQVIKDLHGNRSDYPGVCFESEKEVYMKNCPNPIDFFEGFEGLLS